MIWIPLTIIDNFHSFHSLLTFNKAVSARQSSKSARAAMSNIMQIWSKTCHFWNRNSSSECPLTPNFFIMVGKSMSWRYHFIPPWPLKSEIKSSYLHLNSKNVIFMMTSLLPSFNWDYLAYRWSIFSQIWYVVAERIFYMSLWHLFLIWMKSS